MALTNIPTTQQIIAQNQATYASYLGQTLPSTPQSFLNVQSVVEGGMFTSLYKFGIDRYQASFISTAQGSDLDYLGTEYGVPRLTAIPATVSATLTGTDGTIVPIGTIFNATNGLQYQTLAQYTSPTSGTPGTGFTLLLQAIIPSGQGGASSNLTAGATMNISSTIAGAGLVATVTGTTITGVDAELDAAYRNRLLQYTQTLPSGSNPASYVLWAKQVAGGGVVNAYPYSGAPPSVGTSFPGQRTVYIECTTAIGAQGIPPGSWVGSTGTATGFLGNVALAIQTNPNTGLANEDMGLYVSGLWVQPITRTNIFVQINGFAGNPMSAACQTAVTAAVTAYFLTVAPYISGVTPLFARNDTANVGALSSAVNSVMVNFGFFYQSVTFGTVSGNWLPTYQVGQGEKLWLSSLSVVNT